MCYAAPEAARYTRPGGLPATAARPARTDVDPYRQAYALQPHLSGISPLQASHWQQASATQQHHRSPPSSSYIHTKTTANHHTAQMNHTSIPNSCLAIYRLTGLIWSSCQPSTAGHQLREQALAGPPHQPRPSIRPAQPRHQQQQLSTCRSWPRPWAGCRS